MATIVNNPPAADSSSGVGFIVGMLIVAMLLGALFYWGVPMLRQSSGPSINVPDTVNVTVTQPTPAQ